MATKRNITAKQFNQLVRWEKVSLGIDMDGNLFVHTEGDNFYLSFDNLIIEQLVYTDDADDDDGQHLQRDWGDL